jgi:Zn-dependent metalloprotease
MLGVTSTRRVRASLAPTLLAAMLGLSACDSGTSLGEPGEEPQTLTVSASYRQSDPDDAYQRLSSLTEAIAELRGATSSGWVGRQDDLTGYLGELSGGRYAPEGGGDENAAITGLMEEYGGDLFGVGPADLILGPPSAPTIADVVSVRATQELAGVPVIDGSLVFSLEVTDTEARVNAVRGRVFPGLSPATTPTVGARAAVRTARRASGGQPRGKPTLAIVPVGGGRLAWEIRIGTAPGDLGQANLSATYYVDAQSGAVIDVRAESAEALTMLPSAYRGLNRTGLVAPTRVAAPAAHFPAAQSPAAQSPAAQSPAAQSPAAQSPAAQAPAEGAPVQVSGSSRMMGDLTATGIERGGGVALIDPTTPTYDPATGQGGVETYDIGGLSPSDLPGRLVTSGTPQIQDGDAIAAHALSRAVYDYYASLGRRSWDDRGSSMVSSVNFGDADFCNAYFDDSLPRPQMVYGVPCGTYEFVEIDTAAHEITHGVTASSANLIYSGQSGALNEAFSDYFGNVIGNSVTGSDTGLYAELGCSRMTEPAFPCVDADGTLTTRNLLSGNSFADYFYLLNTGVRYNILVGDNNDNGGVHSNSLIWTNALWGIRTRLAQIDGVSGNESQLATDFDKIVYAVLTTQLGPTSGFLDARSAVEQTIQAADADPTILRVAREIFDANQICADCNAPANAFGQVVVSSPQTQLGPTVSGDDVAWVDLSADGAVTGFAATSAVGGEPTSRTGNALSVAFAGDSLVSFELPDFNSAGEIALYDAAGNRQQVGSFGDSTILAGLAGSDAGAAWSTEVEGSAYFVSPAGEVTELDLAEAGISSVTAVGTGDGQVAIGTDAGRVYLWDPAGGSVADVGSTPGAVFSIATAGGRVLALDSTQVAVLLDGEGGSTQLSESAVPYGAALNGDYAVWPDSVGALGGGIAEDDGGGSADTDLHLYSLETGTIYNLLQERGQQAFPAISGDRLVWQDAVYGGDDIMTAELPPGL